MPGRATLRRFLARSCLCEGDLCLKVYGFQGLWDWVFWHGVGLQWIHTCSGACSTEGRAQREQSSEPWHTFWIGSRGCWRKSHPAAEAFKGVSNGTGIQNTRKNDDDADDQTAESNQVESNRCKDGHLDMSETDELSSLHHVWPSLDLT